MANVLSQIELVFWNLPEGDGIPLNRIKELLASVDIPTKYAPALSAQSSFRRAIDSLGKEYDSKLFRPKGAHRSGDLHVQIDRIGEYNGQKLERATLGVYRLSHYGQISWASPESSEELFQKLRTLYQHHLSHCMFRDMSGVISDVLVGEGLGAYSPRRAGGVYFVPVASTLLDKVERFCQALGIRFLRYTVPDTVAQRGEIMDAVSEKMAEYLAEHEKAIADYTPTTRPEIFAERRRLIQETVALIGKLEAFLNGHASELLAKAQSLQSALSALVNSAPKTMARRLIYCG
jgi:hypothetical protein